MAGIFRGLLFHRRLYSNSLSPLSSHCKKRPPCISRNSIFLPRAHLPSYIRLATRLYTSSNGDSRDSDGDGGENKEKEGKGEKLEEDAEGKEEGEGFETSDLELLPVPRHHAIAPVNIPDYFPEIPLLPLSRNPIFPRFVKMLEVRGQVSPPPNNKI